MEGESFQGAKHAGSFRQLKRTIKTTHKENGTATKQCEGGAKWDERDYGETSFLAKWEQKTKMEPKNTT